MVRILAAAAFLFSLAGCQGSSTGPSPSDLPATADGTADISILNDAVMLEIRSDAPWEQDVHVSADTLAPEDVAPGEVIGIEDVPAPSDAGTDAASFLDLPGPGDANGPDFPPPDDVQHPPFCGDREMPCEEGTTCVTDADGASRCVPLGECSGDGSIDLEELVRLLTTGQGQVQVKVRAMAWPGKPACSPLPCPPDDPCCNTCFAPLFIGAETFPIVLNGHGTTIGCRGNECDVLDGCHPFTLSSWYWVWGTAGIVGGKAQLTVDGFCLADDQQTF